MADYFGWRMKFGLITPSTNTSMEPEMDSIRPTGVTNHNARMNISTQAMDNKAGFNRMLSEIDTSIEEYFADQIWHGFVDDEYFDRAYDVAGPSRILWVSDFPHPRNTFPNSHAVLDRVLTNVPDDVKADVSGLNAARLWNLEVPAHMAEAAE